MFFLCRVNGRFQVKRKKIDKRLQVKWTPKRQLLLTNGMKPQLTTPTKRSIGTKVAVVHLGFVADIMIAEDVS